MTTTNVTEPSRLNGPEKNMQDKDRTPEEIQLEIARTKSAITEDLRVLSERFSPQHLREGAREVMRDAREEANLLIREAKEATIGSLIGAKDRAVESVKESVSEKVHQLGNQAKMLGDQALVLGDRAKQAGDMTVRFVSKNAVAFSLLGVGAGWLLMALRNYRRSHSDDRHEYYALPTETQHSRLSDTVRSVAGEARESARSLATSATHAADRARAEARSALEVTRETVQNTRVQARRAAQQTRGAVRGAIQNSGRLAADNKVAVVALTVAAGLGLSLLFPVGRRPRRALVSAGERVWDEASARAHQLSSRAQSSAHRLAERAQSAAHTLTDRARPSV